MCITMVEHHFSINATKFKIGSFNLPHTGIIWRHHLSLETEVFIARTSERHLQIHTLHQLQQPILELQLHCGMYLRSGINNSLLCQGHVLAFIFLRFGINISSHYINSDGFTPIDGQVVEDKAAHVKLLKTVKKSKP